jgi:hypothetical protein
MAATSEEGEDIRQDLKEDHRAGDWKTNSLDFNWATGSDCLDILEGVPPPKKKTKEELSKAQSLEQKMMVVHLDRLAPYQETTRDEQF